MKTQTAKPAPPRPEKSKTAVRGKYFNQLPQGTNLAIIEPELHKHFPDSESVNKALRTLLEIRKQLEAVAPARPAGKRQAQAA